MGDQGPCGPCSEIHFDRLGNRDAAHLVNQDDPNVLEIWNLVFIQYNREPDGTLRTLPNQHVDTGMGLERLVSVLQNKLSNYDTDVFAPLFQTIQRLTGAPVYGGRVGVEDVDGVDMAYRVIADHARTLTFAISDGGMPSNEGRGYVLRRILRRGVRYARRRFGVQLGSFFPSLVDTVVEQMSEPFPELTKRVEEIKEILSEEELSFAKTLDRGERLFEQCMAKARAAGSTQIDGQDAFRLYDTFGFPIDLTRLMAAENGFTVDEATFLAKQNEAKELSRSKKNSKKAGELVKLDVHALGDLEKRRVAPTQDGFKYRSENINATILAIYSGNQFVDKVDGESAPPSHNFGLVLDKTNFYGESGGQEGDTGSITIDSANVAFAVEDVQVFGSYVLHIGFLKDGQLKVGDDVTCSFDETRRWPLRNNHTATHLLNYALKHVTGEEIDQKGSLVAQDKLRFDFSCRTALSTEQLARVEAMTNEFIREAYPVYSREVPLALGKKIRGLRAVFGETYPDPVRVVSVRYDIEDMLKDPDNPKWESTSIEFCGGTHVAKTHDIRHFAIMEESSISKGVRRVVAVTGEEAFQASRLAEEFQQRLEALEKGTGASLEAALKTAKVDLDQLAISTVRKQEMKERLGAMQKKFMEADKVVKAEQLKKAMEQVNQLLEEKKPFFALRFDGLDNKNLISIVTHVKNKGGDTAALFINVDPDAKRVMHQCVVPKALVGKGLSATEWADVVCSKVGGKKGGRDETAQGSGDNPAEADAALDAAIAFAKLKLGQ